VAQGNAEKLWFYEGFELGPTLIQRERKEDVALDTGAEVEAQTQTLMTELSDITNAAAHKTIDEIATAFHSIVGTEPVPESLLQGLQKLANAAAQLKTKLGLDNLIYETMIGRTSRGRRMHVQPTSVARRKRTSGSQTAQLRGREAAPLNLQERPKRPKRSHSLKHAVNNNWQNATKH
jgi:hypothetical protein